MNSMKKWMMIPVVTALVISGCSENSGSSIEEPDLNSNEIAIDAFVPKMQKGIDATTSTLASGISIYAYQTGEPYSASPFMKGTLFTKPSEGYWTSQPVMYWPMYPLDFYGFYPKSVAPENVAEPTKFSYTVLPDVANQSDVVTSFVGKQERDLVQMEYHHALSKVNFRIVSYANSGLDIAVNSIAVKNIPMSADFTYNTSATGVPDYYTVSNQAPVNPSTGISTLTEKTPLIIKGSTVNEASAPITGMYLIPHKLNNWAYTQTNAYPMTGTYININGELTGVTDYKGNIAIPIATTEWQPGYSYTYNIIFGQPGGSTGGGGYNPDKPTTGGNKPEQILMPIQVSVTVDKWIDVSEPDINL